MTTEEEAEKLATWLRSPAGTAPPEGLSPEVLAAVVTLRPERAPAPRVSIDAIFDSVERGPFKRGEVVAFTPRRSNLPRWILAVGSSGVLAAAAVALLIIPLAQNALTPDAEFANEQVSAPPPAAPAESGGDQGAGVSAGRTASAPSSRGEPAGTSLAPEADPQKAPLAANKDREAAAGTVSDASAGPGEGNPYGLWERPAAEAVPAAAPPPPAPQADARRYDAPQDKDAADQPVIAEAEQMNETDRLIALGYVSDDESKPDRAAAPSDELNKASSAPAGGAAPAAARAPAATTTTAVSQPESKAKKEAASPAKASERQESSAGTGASSASTSSRATAVPNDYESSWYQSYPDVSAAYARGDHASLLNDSRSNVAMDAAWRAATAAWRSGDSKTALSLVDAGLRRSSTNTPVRSQLLLLQGDIYTAAGDSTRAAAAWSEAAALNRTR